MTVGPHDGGSVDGAGGGDDGPRQVGETLGRLVRHLGWAERAESVGALARWAEVVGPAIAAHARPVALDAGVLTIAVDDPAWASQLRWLERQLLEQLSAAGVGPLHQLVVRVRHG